MKTNYETHQQHVRQFGVHRAGTLRPGHRGFMHRVDGAINLAQHMVNDELDELFAQAEQDAAAFVEARRAYLLQLQASSDLWNDSELEDRILYGPMDNDNYTAVYIKLHQALSRPDTRGRWTQTQMARWMRRVFFQN